MDPGYYRCAHVGYYSKVWEPWEPFASFAFCILRTINYLAGTLKRSVCTFQKHKIISYQGPSVNTVVVFQHGLHVRF